MDPIADVAMQSLGTISVDAEIAPYRLALLFEQDDPDQMQRAFRTTARLWGGAGFPILPVRDGVVPAGFTQAAKVLQAKAVLDFTRQRYQDSSAWKSSAESPWPVAVARMQDERHWLRGVHPLISAGLGDRVVLTAVTNSLTALAGPGVIPEEEVDDWVELGVRVLRQNDTTQLAIGQLVDQSVMDATRSGDRAHTMSGGLLTSTGLIWVAASHDSVDDIVAFWMMRSLRPNTRRAVSALVTLEEARSELFSGFVRQSLIDTATSDPSVIISSESVDGRTLAGLAKRWGLSRHAENKVTENLAAGARDPDAPVSYMVKIDPRQWWLGQRRSGGHVPVNVALQRPSSTVAFSSPVQIHPRMSYTGHVLASFASPVFLGPHRESVAQLYLPQSNWTEDGRLEALTVAALDYAFTVGIPEAHEILEASCAGVTLQPSDKLRQIEGVLAALGNQLQIVNDQAFKEVVRVLTLIPNRDVRHKLDALLSEGMISPEEAAGVMAELGEQRLPYKSLTDIKATALPGQGKPRLASMLNILVAVGLIHRGFALVCEECGNKHFQSLEAAGRVATCEGCGSQARFVGPNHEPELVYRLNSLLQTVSVNGGVAPLAATALLRREGAYVRPGILAKRGQHDLGDCDVLGWHGSMLFAGEAKVTPAAFTSEQIAADLARSLELGVGEHLLICADSVPASIADDASAACEHAGIEFRLLDGDELFGASTTA